MPNFIKTINLSVGYDDEIINDINIEFKKGEFIGIIGKNGCGKTTLLRGILSNAKIYKGTVMVDDIEFNKLSIKKRANYIAMLPQKTDILTGISVKDVVEMGLYPKNTIFNTISQVQRLQVVNAVRKFGIEHLLNENCANLSEGQKQLVHLARLFVQNAPFLLLDEPDASLDFQNRHNLLSILAQMTKSQEYSVMMIVHDPSVALRWCDKIYIMDKGTICDMIDLRKNDLSEIQQKLRKIYNTLTVKYDKEQKIYWCFM